MCTITMANQRSCYFSAPSVAGEIRYEIGSFDSSCMISDTVFWLVTKQRRALGAALWVHKPLWAASALATFTVQWGIRQADMIHHSSDWHLLIGYKSSYVKKCVRVPRNATQSVCSSWYCSRAVFVYIIVDYVQVSFSFSMCKFLVIT